MSYFSEYDYNNELYHYGVKGMKWGVRHDKPHPNKKNTMKKKIVVGAAIAGGIIATLGGIYLYKELNTSLYGYTYKNMGKLKDLLDDFSNTNGTSLKKGQKLQRLSTEMVEDYTKVGRTYVSNNFFDNAKYKKRLPTEDWFAGKKKYLHKLELKKDVKIASSREAAKTYLNLHPEAKHYEYKNFISYGLKNDNDPNVKTFISELNKKGYSGMIDENDASWTKSPIIIFNPEQNVKTKNVRKLHYIERVVSTYFV